MVTGDGQKLEYIPFGCAVFQHDLDAGFADWWEKNTLTRPRASIKGLFRPFDAGGNGLPAAQTGNIFWLVGLVTYEALDDLFKSNLLSNLSYHRVGGLISEDTFCDTSFVGEAFEMQLILRDFFLSNNLPITVVTVYGKLDEFVNEYISATTGTIVSSDLDMYR